MKELTGYPSIDNIHNREYSFSSKHPFIPNMSIYNAINYLGNRITYEELLNINIIYNKFLLERYLYKANFKKVKYIKSIKQIYKNKINFINNVNEIKVLEKIFK